MNEQGYNFLELKEPNVFSENKALDAKLYGIKENADFSSQFNFQVLQFFASVGGIISYTALPDILKKSTPFTLFGCSEYNGGFINVQKLFSETPWIFRNSYGGTGGGYILGKDDNSFGYAPFIQAKLKNGDLIFQYTYTAPGPILYLRFIVVRCPQNSMGNILFALNSDKIKLSMIRYITLESEKEQMSNQLVFSKTSILGKTQFDMIDPLTYVTGQTYNTNISDIPVICEIDKNISISSLMNIETSEINFVITCEKINKL